MVRIADRLEPDEVSARIRCLRNSGRILACRGNAGVGHERVIQCSAYNAAVRNQRLIRRVIYKARDRFGLCYG